MIKVDDAFTGVNKTKLGMLKQYFEDELAHTYNLLLQGGIDINLIGRHQGKAEYLNYLIKHIEFVKNNKKVVDNR